MSPVHHHHGKGSLAYTGTDVEDLLPPALLMLLAGGVATVAGRRRKHTPTD
ncbi:MAG TPA: hypothetical protein VIR27_06930 [Mycobacteriales bacterium]